MNRVRSHLTARPPLLTIRQMDVDLYPYLRSQFSDLASAKIWAHHWAQEQEAGRPLAEFGSISSRAMAAHISNVLEGKDRDESGSRFTTNYLSTRYGPDLYEAMWSAWSAGVSDYLLTRPH
jgi:hypothetical protein